MKLLNLGCGTRYHCDWINVDLYATGPGVIPCDLRKGLPFTDNSFDVVYHSHLLEHFSKTFAPVFLRECFRVLKKGGIIRIVTPDLEQIVRTYLEVLEEVEAGSKEKHERYNWITLELLDQMVRHQPGGEMFKYWSQDPVPAADFVFERMGSEFLHNLANLQSTSISEIDSLEDQDNKGGIDALRVGQFRLSGEVHQWMYDRYALKVLLQEAGFQEVRVCQANESSIPNFNSYLLDIEEDGTAFKPGSLYMEGRKAGKDQLQSTNNDSADAVKFATETGTSYQLSEVMPKSTQSLLHECGAKLAELSQHRDMAVEEIHKRDSQLAELRQGLDSVLENIPSVSIVTPSLNSERWIEFCIDSVLNQDYPKIEHIIIDGGSTDGTLEVCRRYPHLIVHSSKDRGQSHAINKGFAMAQGDILAWLCADDEYEPGAVSAAVKAIMAGHNVIMGLSRYIDAQGQMTADHEANAHPYYDHDMFIRFWKYHPVSQPATFWTRNMWETCGPLRENLYFAMDYDLWLRMSQESRFHLINGYTARYRNHPEAKCYVDNYGPRVELIKVSRKYWPSKWRFHFWKLYLHYLCSRSPITQHFTDGVHLLQESVTCLDNSKRSKAVYLFAKAHYKHFATPFLPGYKLTLKRILKEGVGPAWFWPFAKRLWYSIRRKNR